MTLVKREFISNCDIRKDWLVKEIGFLQKGKVAPTADVCVQVADRKMVIRAAVLEALPHDVVLGKQAIEDLELVTLNLPPADELFQERNDKLEALSISKDENLAKKWYLHKY